MFYRKRNGEHDKQVCVDKKKGGGCNVLFAITCSEMELLTQKENVLGLCGQVFVVGDAKAVASVTSNRASASWHQDQGQGRAHQ